MYGHRICSQVSSDCTDRVLGSCCRLAAVRRCQGAVADNTPAPVSVARSFPLAMARPAFGLRFIPLRSIYSHGHILFLDSAASDLYDLAPGASTPTEIIGPEPSNKDASDCSLLESCEGSYWNSGIAFDELGQPVYYGPLWCFSFFVSRSRRAPVRSENAALGDW